MNTGFRSQCVPAYRLLTENQIREIHLSTLELLETVGVRVLDPEGVEMLKAVGCRIKNENTVKIPNWLVEASIHSAPSRITIYDRKGLDVMHLEGNKFHFGLGTDLLKTYDPVTGKLRQSRLSDVVTAARIADYLDEIDFIASNALPHDVPTNMIYIDSFKAQVENSIKPVFFTSAGLEDLSVIVEMAEAISGGPDELREKPFIIHYSEPLSPLVHSPGALKKLFFCADKEIPVTYTPGMLSGATGPATLAGAITVANAEALSGIVLHQLRAKGAPIISGFGIATMDMLTAAPIYGCPEYRLALSACADLYHFYGIPMWGTAGASDANCLDQQAGWEAGISLLTAALDGANLVHDVGYLGQGTIGSPAHIVMCAEIISYVKRIVRGFEITPERIDMAEIRQLGPGGNFLLTDHTLKFHKLEHWRPKFSNRNPLNTWIEKGSRTHGEIAAQKAMDILKTHSPEPLPDEKQMRLETIRRKAEKELADIRFEA